MALGCRRGHTFTPGLVRDGLDGQRARRILHVSNAHASERAFGLVEAPQRRRSWRIGQRPDRSWPSDQCTRRQWIKRRSWGSAVLLKGGWRSLGKRCLCCSRSGRRGVGRDSCSRCFYPGSMFSVFNRSKSPRFSGRVRHSWAWRCA